MAQHVQNLLPYSVVGENVYRVKGKDQTQRLKGKSAARELAPQHIIHAVG